MTLILILISLVGMALAWPKRNRTWGKALLTAFTVLLLVTAVMRLMNPPGYRDKVHEAYSRHFLAAGIGVGEQLLNDFPDAKILFIDYDRKSSSPVEKAGSSFLRGLRDSMGNSIQIRIHRIPFPQNEAGDESGDQFQRLNDAELAAMNEEMDVDLVFLGTGIPLNYSLEDLKRPSPDRPAIILMRETSPAWQSKVQRGEIYGILETVGTQQMDVKSTPDRPLDELYRERFQLRTR